MHTFLDNFQQGGKYSAQIAIHQEESRGEENFVDWKLLSKSALQIYYLILDNSVRNTERDFFSQSRWSQFGGSRLTEECFKQQRK